MELKEKLVALRKEKGLTQSAVAEKLDVSRQAISRWESGIALPSTEEYYKDWKNRPQAEGRFNPDIVLEAITSHAEAYTFDMEYCDYLRAMHQLDPNLFIRTISDLSKEEIQLIATQIETTIKVYKGSTLVAERTGGSPDMVYARWSINLALNSNHLGTLYFYYASGAQAHHCDAKGKSGKGYTWDKEYGHTPPGDYYGETGGPSKDTEKYGPNKFIRMKGNQDPGYENLYVDGDYVTRGRSGLLIHGGRDQTSLWNTEGCVRIFDKDAKKITGLMDSWRSAGYHQFGRIKITRPGQSL